MHSVYMFVWERMSNVRAEEEINEPMDIEEEDVAIEEEKIS